MANATRDLGTPGVSDLGYKTVVPIAEGATIFSWTMVSQLPSGYYVPATTEEAGNVIGVATHHASDTNRALRIETDRVFLWRHDGTLTETTLFGSVVFASDDNNVSASGDIVAGYFYGLHADGRARVLITGRAALQEVA